MPKSKLPHGKPTKNGHIFGHFVPEQSVAPRKNKEGALSKQVEALKQEIELLTSYASDTIYRLRYKDMVYDYISPAVTRLLGFTPEEMCKINFRSLILETKIVTNGMKTVNSFDELEVKRQEGDVNKWHADYLMRTKDGRKVWVSDVSYPWFDDKGTIIGSIGSMRDITERVEAEDKIKQELAMVANTDALTGLGNRRQFFDQMAMEIKRMQRTNCDVSMLLLDVDHFKRVNDEYGHDVGDHVLCEISGIIKDCLRDTDLAARIGGEEFAIILPDTPADGAYWVAERIRLSILKHGFTAGTDQKPLGCTVSIGVATASMGDEVDATSLYKLADTRLYIAKNTGRNQVSVDEILHTH